MSYYVLVHWNYAHMKTSRYYFWATFKIMQNVFSVVGVSKYVLIHGNHTVKHKENTGKTDAAHM